MLAEHLVHALLESEIEFSHVYDSAALDWSVWGAPDGWDLGGYRLALKWRVDVDVRSYGIKEITPIIDQAEIFIHYVDQDEEGRDSDGDILLKYPVDVQRPTDETDPQAMAQFYADKPLEIEIEWRDRSGGPVVYPTALELDLRTRKATITFG